MRGALALILLAGFVACIDPIPAQQPLPKETTTEQAITYCTNDCDCPYNAFCSAGNYCAPRFSPVPMCSCDWHCGSGRVCADHVCVGGGGGGGGGGGDNPGEW